MSLYTSNEPMKIEIKNTMLFTIIQKKEKFLGLNLTKPLWDLHAKNY